MPDLAPLKLSHQLLSLMQTQLYTFFQDRIPQEGSLIVVSNHRSIMDVPVVMAALNRPVRFACHHYMGQVPVLKDVVTQLGAIPLDEPAQRQQTFFQQASDALHNQDAIGIFPEGAQPMVNSTLPQAISNFHRGFAHLALRSTAPKITILPVAIASRRERNAQFFPVRMLSWFDPTEPLFYQPGLHPFIIYQRVNVLIGRPIQITPAHREGYQGKLARQMVSSITQQCHTEIATLLSSPASLPTLSPRTQVSVSI
jgi:1-acyl-sn-glycerol-3-phosphate acyltransferase